MVDTDKSLDISKATIFESRCDSSIFYQKPVDEVILLSDMKRPSTSSLSSTPSDLVLPRKKRVVIGKTNNKLEEAICNEAEIQDGDLDAKAKLHQPLLTHRQAQGLIALNRILAPSAKLMGRNPIWLSTLRQTPTFYPNITKNLTFNNVNFVKNKALKM